MPTNAANLSFTVGRIEVEGTFPGFAGETQAVLGPVRGKRITVAQLYELATALEHAYAAAGYILARVSIPPQKLRDGVTVRFAVIDGRIERIDVRNVPERLRNAVMARMAPIVGEPHITLAEIERRLLLTSDLPGIRLRSTLAAGTTPGGTLLIVEGEQSYVTGTVSVDNRLPRSLGMWTTNSNFAANDVLGFGEQFYGSYSASPDLSGSRLQIFGGGLVAPIGSDGLTINPEYTESIAQPAPSLGAPATIGDFRRVALHLNYPLIRTRAETLALTATIEGDEETLSPTGFSTDLYRDEYAAARFQAGYDFFLPWGAPVHFGGTFSQGLGGRHGTAAVPLSAQGSNPDFSKFNVIASLQQPLPESFQFGLTAQGQVSFDKPMMVAEQIDLDGTNALSTFASGTLPVDQGGTLRAELSRPFLAVAFGSPVTISPYVFGAAGIGELVMPTAVQRHDIDAESLGAGVRTGAGIVGAPVGATIAIEGGREYSNLPGLGAGYRINFLANLAF